MTETGFAGLIAAAYAVSVVAELAAHAFHHLVRFTRNIPNRIRHLITRTDDLMALADAVGVTPASSGSAPTK